MAITKITTPLNNIELLGKINEIIDEINNYATTKPCVSNVSVEGTTMTVTLTDGSTLTPQTLPDTTYSNATSSKDGLMSSTMYNKLSDLGTSVTALEARVSSLEPDSSS